MVPADLLHGNFKIRVSRIPFGFGSKSKLNISAKIHWWYMTYARLSGLEVCVGSNWSCVRVREEIGGFIRVTTILLPDVRAGCADSSFPSCGDPTALRLSTGERDSSNIEKLCSGKRGRVIFSFTLLLRPKKELKKDFIFWKIKDYTVFHSVSRAWTPIGPSNLSWRFILKGLDCPIDYQKKINDHSDQFRTQRICPK